MLDGQRILITGANGGIGLSIAEILLKNKAKLVLFYHQKRSQIDSLLDQFSELRTNAETHQVDLLDYINLDYKLSEILDNNKIDGFIHCVTLPIVNKGILDMDWKDFQSHIELQTKSFFQIVKALIPSMKERKNGKIIAILTSYTVGKPPNRISDYIVGKYSLLGFIKSLAVELGAFGITVNSISPSMANTPLTNKLPSKLKEITANQNPMGRLAEPSDISHAVLYLCSKFSNYVNGENFLITGGGEMH